jgi:hypothetical protein
MVDDERGAGGDAARASAYISIIYVTSGQWWIPWAAKLGRERKSAAPRIYVFPAAMHASPQSTSSVAQVSSPGEALSKRLAAFLQRQKFATVLGLETIDAWEVDWPVMENPDISFCNPRKAALMSQLHSRLREISKMPQQSDDFKKFHYEFIMLRADIGDIHAERLKICAGRFLAQRFPNATAVRFFPKLAGVQLGTRAHVTLPDGELLNYYMKTHSGGKVTSASSAARAVDPRELLVYKVLEHLGVGCETHFFHRSIEDVFIATLDAGHAEGSSFSTFQRATGIHETCGEPIHGDTLWGSLHSQLNRHKDFRVIEDDIQGDHIAQNFLLQVASLDMISRIFRLRDLLSNANNFGFCTSPTGTPCLKVLDFRLTDDTDASVGQAQFDGFLVGNGMFNYERSHTTLRYAFRDRPRVERVKTALYLLTAGSLCKSQDCIQSAYADVQLFLESSFFGNRDQEEAASLLLKLEEFRRELHRNVDFFTSALKSIDQ